MLRTWIPTALERNPAGYGNLCLSSQHLGRHELKAYLRILRSFWSTEGDLVEGEEEEKEERGRGGGKTGGGP